MNKNGKVVSISGPVVNIMFPECPPLPGDTLETIIISNGKEETILLETVAVLSPSEVRAVALDLTDGMLCGQVVSPAKRKERGITIVGVPGQSMAIHAAVAHACNKMPLVMANTAQPVRNTEIMKESRYPESEGIVLCGHPFVGNTASFLKNSIICAASELSGKLLSIPEDDDLEPNKTAFPLYGLNPNDVFRKNKRKKGRR